jgi:hypothetical protein
MEPVKKLKIRRKPSKAAPEFRRTFTRRKSLKIRKFGNSEVHPY